VELVVCPSECVNPLDTCCQAATTNRGVDILAVIHASPGLTKSELVRKTGMPWGTIWYQVDKLEKNGLIQTLKRRKEVSLFPTGIGPNRIRWLAEIRRPESAAILQMFRSKRELTILDAVEHAGISRRVARERLATLLEAGITEPRGNGRPRFALNPEVWNVVQHLLPAVDSTGPSHS